MKFLFICLLFSVATTKICIAGIHGLKSNCVDLGSRLTVTADNLANSRSTGKDTPIEGICINQHSNNSSLFNDLQTQAEGAYRNLVEARCSEVYLIGISQGAAIANYIVSTHRGNDFTIKGLASFGGINRGVHSLHGKFNNFGLRLGNCLSCIRNPAKDCKRADKGEDFKRTANFLRNAINDTQTFNARAKQNFLDLDRIIIVGYEHENLIKPHETAYFLWADKENNRLPFEDDQFFLEDRLGLLEQFAKGKLGLYESKKEHSIVSQKDIEDAVEVMINDRYFPKGNLENVTSLKQIFDQYTAKSDEKVNFTNILTGRLMKNKNVFSDNLVRIFQSLARNQNIQFRSLEDNSEQVNKVLKTKNNEVGIEKENVGNSSQISIDDSARMLKEENSFKPSKPDHYSSHRSDSNKSDLFDHSNSKHDDDFSGVRLKTKKSNKTLADDDSHTEMMNVESEHAGNDIKNKISIMKSNANIKGLKSIKHNVLQRSNTEHRNIHNESKDSSQGHIYKNLLKSPEILKESITSQTEPKQSKNTKRASSTIKELK